VVVVVVVVVEEEEEMGVEIKGTGVQLLLVHTSPS